MKCLTGRLYVSADSIQCLLRYDTTGGGRDWRNTRDRRHYILSMLYLDAASLPAAGPLKQAP
jgi:hypothetical protein